jgi:hypothetical protein
MSLLHGVQPASPSIRKASTSWDGLVPSSYPRILPQQFDNWQSILSHLCPAWLPAVCRVGVKGLLMANPAMPVSDPATSPLSCATLPWVHNARKRRSANYQRGYTPNYWWRKWHYYSTLVPGSLNQCAVLPSTKSKEVSPITCFCKSRLPSDNRFRGLELFEVFKL